MIFAKNFARNYEKKNNNNYIEDCQILSDEKSWLEVYRKRSFL